MIYIDNRNITNPRLNLALEEYALRHLDLVQDYLLFYINEPSVIIGRHQNTVEEINLNYIEKKRVHVVRRISGGGAVYHDLGNLNFSFLTRYSPKKFNNYQAFNAPIIKALHKIGVPAELTGRNDIVAGGRKISGNAQFTSKDRMFSHGTLLLNSNLDDVVAALNVKDGKIESKGIKSIRSRVANISEFLEEKMDTIDFRDYLLENIFDGVDQKPIHTFSDREWEEIHRLAQIKYGSWEWNFGESPQFNFRNSRRFSFGEIEVRLQVEKGVIVSAKFYGDFFASREIEELENRLTGLRYDKSTLRDSLEQTTLEHYFGGISRRQFLDLLF